MLFKKLKNYLFCVFLSFWGSQPSERPVLQINRKELFESQEQYQSKHHNKKKLKRKKRVKVNGRNK